MILGRSMGLEGRSPLDKAVAAYEEKLAVRRRLARKSSEIPCWRISSRRAARSELNRLESTDRLDEARAIVARELILACVRTNVGTSGGSVWREKNELELRAQASQAMTNMDWHLKELRLSAKDSASLRPLLQEDQVLETISTRIREVQDAVSDPQFVTDESAADGKPHLVIQHVATGLRAEFIDNGDGFGFVNAKPYTIRSICSESPHWPDWWRDYVGLGVGARLHLAAQDNWPKLRWPLGTLTGDASRPLRVKLHRRYPYVWQGDCDWCREHLAVTWKKAALRDFEGHPAIT